MAKLTSTLEHKKTSCNGRQSGVENMQIQTLFLYPSVSVQNNSKSHFFSDHLSEWRKRVLIWFNVVFLLHISGSISKTGGLCGRKFHLAAEIRTIDKTISGSRFRFFLAKKFERRWDNSRFWGSFLMVKKFIVPLVATRDKERETIGREMENF